MLTTDKNVFETEPLISCGIGGCVTNTMGFVSVSAFAVEAKNTNNIDDKNTTESGLKCFMRWLGSKLESGHSALQSTGCDYWNNSLSASEFSRNHATRMKPGDLIRFDFPASPSTFGATPCNPLALQPRAVLTLCSRHSE